MGVGIWAEPTAPTLSPIVRDKCADRACSHALRKYTPLLKTLAAVAYILKNWLALTGYLDDGDLPIDNNRTERSLRGIAVGRNNWTFLGSDRAGKTMAVLRSFVSSCELNQVDPFALFRDVLARIPSHSIQKLDDLLPHNWATALPA